MATLSELRDYVHVQTETTTAELPNTTIDRYLQEAFNRTISAENRWPFYETEWNPLTQSAGNAFLTCPSTLNKTAIVSLRDTNNDNYRLTQIDQEAAEDSFFNVVATGEPTHFSLWGEFLYLWPATEWTTDRDFILRGYRKPTDWIADGASAEVDADEKLHYPLAHYAIALAYAQQEDEVLESTYMARWQRDVEMARKMIMEPSRNSPVRMGGGRFRSNWPANWTWNL